MKPSIGRIVHYNLTQKNADEINRRRTTGLSIAERIKVLCWPLGAQAHIGNEAKEGDLFPMLIIKIWGDTETSCINGQVFLDGNDVIWVTSVNVGEGPGYYSWPVKN